MMSGTKKVFVWKKHALELQTKTGTGAIDGKGGKTGNYPAENVLPNRRGKVVVRKKQSCGLNQNCHPIFCVRGRGMLQLKI